MLQLVGVWKEEQVPRPAEYVSQDKARVPEYSAVRQEQYQQRPSPQQHKEQVHCYIRYELLTITGRRFQTNVEVGFDRYVPRLPVVKQEHYTCIIVIYLITYSIFT